MSTLSVSHKNGITAICPNCAIIMSSTCERTLKMRIKMHFKRCKQLDKPIDYNEVIAKSQELAKQEQQRYIGFKPKSYKMKKEGTDTFLEIK
jgi:hypothetical protein